MNCKKCGYPLVPGQTICSNCDEYNEAPTNIVNNFESYNYQEKLSENTSYYDLSDIEIEKKPFPKWIIFVAIAVIFVPLVVLGLIFSISDVAITSQLSKEKNNSFITTYRMLRKQVLTNRVSEQPFVCNDDCNLIYDYDENNINFYVEDKGSYYEITYEAKEYGKYGSIDLKSKDCENITDTTCDKRVITGKVYKD